MAAAEQVIQVPARATKPSFWDQFKGKRLVVQTKGRIIMTGTFTEYTENGFLVLEQPTIKGIHVKARPPKVFVDRGQIGHFHEECETSETEDTPRRKPAASEHENDKQ